MSARQLPHWQQPGVTYFITFRLADSLPQEKLREWAEERAIWLQVHGLTSLEQVAELGPEKQREFDERFGEQLQRWLDAGYGECWLARPEVAEAMESALRYFDGERYALGEFVIMPNHVHLLVTLADGVELSKVLQSWKTFSAKRVNELVGHEGQVWQSESYDHIVRTEEQFRWFERYIQENPAKAGLKEGRYRVGRGDAQGLRASDVPAESSRDRLQVCPTLKSFKIRHFRCFESFEAEFDPGLNLIIGPNAHGKTSLLEAACILLRLQTPRASRLADVIQHDRRGFVVDGYFGDRHLQFYFSRERKKLALDSVEQKSAQEYLQLGHVVYFSNSDIEIVRGSGDARRRFLDFVLVQRDSGYRRALRDYERALRSRNLLLKASSPRWREIAAFDEPLIATGDRISTARRNLLSEMQPLAEDAHRAISGAKEVLRLEYQSGSGEDFKSALAAAEREDARLRQTTVGPHRDDVGFYLNERSSSFASEGQQRTLVLALKLGAANLLAAHFETPPVLLLDDIFGELDPVRRAALLHALPARSQQLITTTNIGWLPPELSPRILRLGESQSRPSS
ncbi:DNA replication/repair protein RecF [Verrucomicrobiota bacterium sgz303538]